MATELTEYVDAHTGVAPVPAYLTGNTLQGWAEEARAAATIAASLVRTPFIPESLRVYFDEDKKEPNVEATTAAVTAALLTGQELGMTPMAAMRSIDVIKGTPALRAIALRALVQRAGHEIWLVESSKVQAVVSGRRQGSQQVQSSHWTIERAKDLNLVYKPNWKQQPAAMLVARATAECARLIASDVLLGMPYAVEELEDDSEAVDAAPPAARKRAATAQRRLAPAPDAAETQAAAGDHPTPPPPVPVDEPPFDDVVETTPAAAASAPYTEHPDRVAATAPLPEPEPAQDDSGPPPEPPPVSPPPRMVNAAQRRAIFAAMRDLGIADDQDRHAVMSRVTGRQIESTNHLMMAEAIQVLTELDAMREARDDAQSQPDDETDAQLFEEET